MLASRCVELCSSRSAYGLTNNLGTLMLTFPAFQLVFVHVKHTSNMAACYDNDVGDVTAPHV